MPYNFYINSDWWSVEETLGNLDLKEFFLDKSDEIFEEHYDDKEWLLYDVAECFKYLEKLAALWASQIEVSNVQPIKDFSKLINSDRLLKLHMQGTAGLCSLLSDVDTSSEAATAEGVSE